MGELVEFPRDRARVELTPDARQWRLTWECARCGNVVVLYFPGDPDRGGTDLENELTPAWRTFAALVHFHAMPTCRPEPP